MTDSELQHPPLPARAAACRPQPPAVRRYLAAAAAAVLALCAITAATEPGQQRSGDTRAELSRVAPVSFTTTDLVALAALTSSSTAAASDEAAAGSPLAALTSASTSGGLLTGQVPAALPVDPAVAALLRSLRESSAAPAADGSRPAPAARTALNFALDQVGLPYVWGAAGPDAYDCSGLMLRAYAAAGIALPRVSADQYAGAGTPVDVPDLLPGDLVFFATATWDPGVVHHVGMYLGRGLMVDAPHTGAYVRVEPVPAAGYVGAVRVAAAVAAGKPARPEAAQPTATNAPTPANRAAAAAVAAAAPTTAGPSSAPAAADAATPAAAATAAGTDTSSPDPGAATSSPTEPAPSTASPAQPKAPASPTPPPAPPTPAAPPASPTPPATPVDPPTPPAPTDPPAAPADPPTPPATSPAAVPPAVADLPTPTSAPAASVSPSPTPPG